MKGYILKNATIITASKEAVGTVIVNDGIIADVIYNDGEGYEEKVTDASVRYPELETLFMASFLINCKVYSSPHK